MLIGCEYCGEILGCTNKTTPTVCEDCIEKDFELVTGQPCQSKDDNAYPEIIICPVCQTIAILSSYEFGYL